MELYIIRHGETVWNAEGKMQGTVDIELNENGRELAGKLGAKLENVHFDRIYSSPLIRAYETACLIRGHRNIPVIRDERLREMCFGIYEGSHFSEWLNDESPYRYLFTEPDKYTPPEKGESLLQVCVRTREFIRKVIEPLQGSAKRIMIVAHGALNSGIMSYLEGRGMENYWGDGLQKNCEAAIYTFDGEKWSKDTSRKPDLSSMALADFIHDLRTPLNNLIGINHLMQVHIGDREKLQEYLYKSDEAAHYMLDLVNNFLDFSKLRLGKYETVCELFDMDALLDEVYRMQVENIRAKNVEFLMDKKLSHKIIAGDKLRIKQVIMNILGNAAKFTSDGGCIKLSCAQEISEGQITTELICEDTGCGMSEDFLEHIWDAYSQEKNCDSCVMNGTGLGMAISYLLVTAMGGSIDVKSKVNKGSIFTVKLYSKVFKKRFDRKLKILLAEDDTSNADIMYEILGEKFDVVRAVNGREAVAVFENSRVGEIDLIIMDINMPIMDGCSATRMIRNLDRSDAKSVVIFACTANTFKENRDRAIASGMNDFFAKPINMNMLLERIGEIQ